MAAMKPRTGDGPMEAVKEGRMVIMRVPLQGGGRLVVELTPDEAVELGQELAKIEAQYSFSLMSVGKPADIIVVWGKKYAG